MPTRTGCTSQNMSLLTVFYNYRFLERRISKAHHGPPLVVVVLLPCPELSHPKALPDPIGFVFVVGVAPPCPPLLSSPLLLLAELSAVTVVLEFDTARLTFAIDRLTGLRTFIVRAGVCREMPLAPRVPFMLSTTGVVLPARHDEAHTPGFATLPAALLADLSLSEVDGLPSSLNRLCRSVDARDSISRGASALLGPSRGVDAAASASMFGESGPVTELNRLGRPIMPGVDVSLTRSDGTICDDIDPLRLRAFVMR